MADDDRTQPRVGTPADPEAPKSPNVTIRDGLFPISGNEPAVAKPPGGPYNAPTRGTGQSPA